MNSKKQHFDVPKLKPYTVAHFIKKETSGGLILLLATVLALFCSNSFLSNWYSGFWEHHLGFEFDNHFYLYKSLKEWINDGLMAIFFFVVGLELKNEMISGELSQPKKAILPIAAAFGGMVVPALIFVLFNFNKPSSAGWGIPMATDIAFSLGILHLLGKKIPTSVKVFLTALAIADDLGAVLVIAFCYTSHISVFNLGIGFLFLSVLIFANKLGAKNTVFYAILGIGGVWLFFLLSGVHATIAAVLIAFTIPAKAKVNENDFSKSLDGLLYKFKNQDVNDNVLLTEKQLETLEEIRLTTKNAMTPLQRLELRLHSFVSFVVLPIFAFANAGVDFRSTNFNDFVSPVALGVVFGLFFGKFIGIVSTTWILIRLKAAKLPFRMTKIDLIGIAFLAGIGFTMSMFVTELAFVDKAFIVQSKIGIFVASTISGLVGYFILKKSKNDKNF